MGLSSIIDTTLNSDKQLLFNFKKEDEEVITTTLFLTALRPPTVNDEFIIVYLAWLFVSVCVKEKDAVAAINRSAAAIETER